jgi:hypothetical protein
MALKRVGWFGPYSLKQLGGISSFTQRPVDERLINWAALQPHMPWLAVVNYHTRVLEFCGESVPIWEMDQLMSPIVPEPPVDVVETEIKQIIVDEIPAAAPAPAATPEPAKQLVEVETAEPSETPIISEEAPKKRGRKKKEPGFEFDF